MCRGIALNVNFDEILFKENNSSHSILEHNIDNYIRIEILFDSTKKSLYKIELDGQNDDDVIKIWTNKQFLLNGKLNPILKKKITKWCKEHKLEIYRSFLLGCQSHSIIKGNNDQTYSTIKKNNYQSDSTIKGDNNQSSSIIKGNNDQSYSIIKGDNYIYKQKYTKHLKLTRLINDASNEIQFLTLDKFVDWLIKKYSR